MATLFAYLTIAIVAGLAFLVGLSFGLYVGHIEEQKRRIKTLLTLLDRGSASIEENKQPHTFQPRHTAARVQ